MRLIDADKLESGEVIIPTENGGYEYVEVFYKDDVDNAPTVEPKHGHWINKGFEPTRCSVCGITVDAINGIPWAIKSFKYCPHCGAKMDEVTECTTHT